MAIIVTDAEKYMRRCLDLAKQGEYYVAPNPMVGAVLVDIKGNIIGEGWHRQFGGPHAEVDCIRDAEEKMGRQGISYKKCTLYVNLEPCCHYGKTPPCAKLILEKQIGRVVVGMLDPNEMVAGKGIQMLREGGVKVITGVLEKECRYLNRRFICLHEKHRPYVILKWAQTQDGYLDSVRMSHVHNKLNEPIVISNSLSKQLVHKLRAENMAIMVGTRTALLDNPRLMTTRWSGRNPIRILLDRHNVVPKDSKIFKGDAETIVYQSNTEWPFILSDLAKRNIHSVIVEGGAILLNTILESGIYDEIHIETSSADLSELSGGIKDGISAPKPSVMPTSIREEFGNTFFEWIRKE